MEVPAPVLVLRAPAGSARAPGLGGCFPSGHRPARLTRYALPGPARPCPAPKLSSDSPTRVSPTSRAPRELE